jgi:hypothetical protein
MDETKRYKEAQAAHADALAIREQLAADLPDHQDIRNSMITTLVNLASLCVRQRQFEAAKRYLEEAQPHHRAALKANPLNIICRDYYRKNLWALAEAHAGLLDQAKAVATAQEIRDAGWDSPADAYSAGVCLCACIGIVAKHKELDAEQRKQAAQFYSDQAMSVLRQAVERGFRDAKKLEQAKQLAPLRSRMDFQALLAEVAERK